ncbi:MAG: hypothetical protein OXU25_02620 [Thaumarchaeota archaeon]|nr:hypothetical protein [Nitrososphaerota archaeon]
MSGLGAAGRRALLLLAKVAAGATGAVAIVACLRVAGIDAPVELTLGAFAAILAGNVIWVAVKSENSRREEDDKTVNDVHFAASQCRHIFDLMAKIKDGQGEDMYRALDQMAIRVRLFVTQYRPYLKPAMVESLRNVERSILDVQIARGPTSRLMSSVGKAIGELDGGIRNVDDPVLAALRRKV